MKCFSGLLNTTVGINNNSTVSHGVIISMGKPASTSSRRSLVSLLSLVSLSAGLILPLSAQSLSRLRHHLFSSTRSLVTPGATHTSLFPFKTALVGELALNTSILSRGTHTLQAGGLLLATMLAIVVELDVCLTL
jgi:hypothetical protein